VLLLGSGAVAAAAVPGGFVFSAPPGWVDVSPDAPAAERQKAPEQLVAIAGNYAFYAADLGSGHDGFMENMNAVVQTDIRPPLATPAMLAAIETQVQDQFSKQGMSYRALKKDVIKVGGVTAGRIVADATTPQGTIRVLQFTIPGDRSNATLTFSTTPENFARYEALFDAAAQATRGAVEPRAGFAMNWNSVGRSAIMGGAAGGIAVLLVALLKRKKASPGTGPTPSP
jgi:hypothetical protein